MEVVIEPNEYGIEPPGSISQIVRIHNFKKVNIHNFDKVFSNYAKKKLKFPSSRHLINSLCYKCHTRSTNFTLNFWSSYRSIETDRKIQARSLVYT